MDFPATLLTMTTASVAIAEINPEIGKPACAKPVVRRKGNYFPPKH
jgi:hypothetical protein